MNAKSLLMNRIARTMLLLMSGVIGGCGSSTPPEHEVMPVKDTVFAPMVNSLDKAKGVQDTLDQSKAQTDAALKNAEQ